MKIDRSKSATENMLALINEGSSFQFSGTEFDVAAPVAVPPRDQDDVTNTTVQLTPKQGSGFEGSKNPRYTRLTIGQTKTAARTSFEITGADTEETLKEAIAVEHNLILDQFEITGELPTQGGNSEDFLVEAIEGSLTHIGSMTVTVSFP